MASTSFDPSLFAPHSTICRPPSHKLSTDQQAKYDEVEAHFSPEFSLPVEEGSDEKSVLSEREMMFLSKNTILRFLIAMKYDAPGAITRLEKCLIWRRTERVDDIVYMSEICSDESRTGKNLVLGFSPTGQPILYFFPAKNMTPPEERKAIHAIYMLERAIDLMGDGVTTMVVIFNLASKRQGPPTSVSVARECLHILSNHYPETLGLNVFLNLPWVAKMFINLMWPFVDPITKKKVKFGTDLVKDGDVEKEWLLKECGGDIDIAYNHEAYWPALLEACQTRREQDAIRWRALGEAKVGREERLFKVYPGSTPAASSQDVRVAKEATTIVDERGEKSASAGGETEPISVAYIPVTATA